MNASLNLTQRALAELPRELQQQICQHRHGDDLGDLIQQTWLTWLEFLQAGGKKTPAEIFARARSDVRRFTQNPAHFGRGFDTLDADEITTTPGSGSDAGQRKVFRARVEADLSVSKRRAQQLVKRKLDAHAQGQGDLFDGGE